jgi:glucose-6-phosphate dehydrogenase assembly protein OpcA
MASAMTSLADDRVRARRWQAADVDLATVVARLHDQQAELARHDVDHEDHPHPRNCVLNLVVTVGDRHRAEACDRLVGSLAASHPLRAILLHLEGGGGPGSLDAEITSEAHQLVSGFPVQREQVLLHVRGDAGQHLASLVEPLLVPDVPTYVWWSGRESLRGARLREAIGFSDVLVVDSERFEHAVEGMLELVALTRDPDAGVGVVDFRWARLKPWRDAIGQFFGPADRRALLRGLREVSAEAGGTGPDSRVSAALLAGWVFGALGWPLAGVTAGDGVTEAAAEADGGHRARVAIRSVAGDRLHHGELLAVRLTGRSGHRAFALSIEHDPAGDHHAHVTIELDGGEPVRQRLTLPTMGDSDLLVHALWASHRDPVFGRALDGAAPLLEALR